MVFLDWLTKDKAPENRAAEAWFESIMSRGLDPYFYFRDFAADTRDGRFVMVSIHGALVLRQLGKLGPEGKALSDRLYRRLFSGFDHALREEGVGDSSIARKMRTLGSEFFGLAQAIAEALDGREAALTLAAVFARNGVGRARTAELAALVTEAEQALGAATTSELLAGRFDWPTLPLHK